MSDVEQLLEHAEDEDQPETPIKIYTAICIEGAGLKKKSWQPAIQSVSGTNFAKFNKWDRYLTTFVTGKGLRLHSSKEHNINRQWFRTMEELRKAACQESLKRVIVQAAEAEGTPVPPKIRPATQQDEYLAGRTVQVTGPAVHNDSEELVHEEHQMVMLWGIKGADLWIELTEANLGYIRLAILHSPPFIQPPPKKAARGGASPKKRRKRGPKSKAALRDDEEADAAEPAPSEDNDVDEAAPLEGQDM
ncbi:unnamed protein product [Symbiodinium sp. CCMP2456]|nr:unnamed protein product [Symbiodinium sp. CCMP2456]